ncbi:MAG: hypothetical protein AB8G86_03175, partial [Saprospiraceae bacterium]
MAKLYKEDQKYHDVFSIGLLGVIGALVAYKVMTAFIMELGVPATTLSVLGLSIIGAIFFYKTLKLKIRISPKKMTFKINPLPWGQLKVNKTEIESLEFFQVTEAELCTGWAMNFGHRSRIFNFGDKAGIIIKKKNGQQVVVFSKKLYEQRAAI